MIATQQGINGLSCIVGNQDDIEECDDGTTTICGWKILGCQPSTCMYLGYFQFPIFLQIFRRRQARETIKLWMHRPFQNLFLFYDCSNGPTNLPCSISNYICSKQEVKLLELPAVRLSGFSSLDFEVSRFDVSLLCLLCPCSGMEAATDLILICRFVSCPFCQRIYQNNRLHEWSPSEVCCN